MLDQTTDLTVLEIDRLLKWYEDEAGVVSDDDCSLERQKEAKENVARCRAEIKRRIPS